VGTATENGADFWWAKIGERLLETSLIFGGQKWRNGFWEGRNYGCWSAAGEGKMSRKKWPEEAKMVGEEEAWVRLVWVRKIQAGEGAAVLEKMRGKRGGRRSLERDGFRVRVFFFCIFLMFQNGPPPLCVLKTNIYRQKILLGFQTWSLNFFFCKFWFFLFFWIFLINIVSSEENQWFLKITR